MSEAPQSQSRALPRLHEITLGKIEAGRREFDGRSSRLIEELEGYEFVAVTDRPDPKNPRKVVVAITERGKNALERSKRGVDPYLVMTK